MATQKIVKSGWLKPAFGSLMLLMVILVLAGCANTSTPLPTPAVTAAVAVVSTSTQAPTPTELPAATETPLPTATATQPPTATPVPALAVLADGFNAWCLPEKYAGTKPGGANAPQDARQLTINGDNLQVTIPATFCTLVYRFNQPVPQGATLTFFDGGSPFLKLPLTAEQDQPSEGWASVNHPYVVNPPYWQVSYKLAVTDSSGKELWSKPVTFAKPIPKGCPFGGLPDPVTLWCAITDPWEVEPHPGVVYPYDHTPFENQGE